MNLLQCHHQDGENMEEQGLCEEFLESFKRLDDEW
jgi:hypothetical protein